MPDFDELVGGDLPPEERERLHRVHELLVRAGPPPELSPEIEIGPSMVAPLRGNPRRADGSRVYRRSLLLAAALLVLVLAFAFGYLAGNSGTTEPAALATIPLKGTHLAPNALASIRLEHRDSAGNWPMRFTVEGLPKLPKGGYYVMFLTRGGKPAAPCGSFAVTGKGATVVDFNAAYDLRSFDRGGWVVTKQLPGHFRRPGPVVLAPEA